MLKCKLLFRSNAEHLSQIYTGFSLLAKSGHIDLSQSLRPREKPPETTPRHLLDARDFHLEAVVGSGTRIYYDVHDSHEIDGEAANEVDYYFKRSFSPLAVSDSYRARILPLGLNYALYMDGLDRFEIDRIGACDLTLKSIARSLGKIQKTVGTLLPFIPTVGKMHAAPTLDLPPRILFMVRAWDPAELTDHPQEKLDERIHINETRARCIRMLRQEFGERFTGGFQHCEYTRKNFGDLLISDNRLTSKRNFIEALRQYPICVSTMGLHGSNGWKLGEYVAFSKAIIGEKPKHELPGNFSDGNNYLSFVTPEQCVAHAHRLFNDEQLRQSLMLNNQQYYREYLRPDVMIKRTLDIALSGKAEP